jgi:hypothetical protein
MRFASSLFFLLAMAIQPKLALPLQADVRAHQIVLKVGEDAELDDGRLRLRFERVLADSRCPRGARCIRAGEAKVEVWVQEGSEPGRSLIVAGPAPVFFPVSRSYSAQMKSLNPYPELGPKKRPEYVLTLLLSKTDDL